MDVGSSTATITDGGNSASAPASFAEAFAADASPASDPSGQTSTSAATAQPPTASEATPAQEDRSPFIPRARFDEVNTRMQAAETWKQQYGWAEHISEADLRQAIAIAQRTQADPIGYMQEFIAELQNHPVHAKALQSLAGRALASARGQHTMPEPDVAITDAAGNVVGQTYSAAQMAKRDEWLFGQWMAKVDDKYAPVMQTHEQYTKQVQDAKDKAEAEQHFGAFGAELHELYPNFDQHKDAVRAEVIRRLGQLPATDPRQNDASFLEAVTLRAAHTVIGAANQTSAETRVLDSLKQRAHASRSVNPSSAGASTPKDITSFNQLGPDAWK